jgi:hypothetical protein
MCSTLIEIICMHEFAIQFHHFLFIFKISFFERSCDRIILVQRRRLHSTLPDSRHFHSGVCQINHLYHGTLSYILSKNYRQKLIGKYGQTS